MNRVIALVAALISAAMPASVDASIVKWTITDIAFDKEYFQSNHLFGSFEYDQSTNIFSSIDLGFKSDSACCWSVGVITATSNASTLNLSTVGYGGSTFHIDLASPMTDAGGVIAVKSGNFGSDRMVRAGQSISAPVTSPVPEPVTWALMLAGFAMVGGVMRRRKTVVRFA